MMRLEQLEAFKGPASHRPNNVLELRLNYILCIDDALSNGSTGIPVVNGKGDCAVFGIENGIA